MIIKNISGVKLHLGFYNQGVWLTPNQTYQVETKIVEEPSFREMENSGKIEIISYDSDFTRYAVRQEVNNGGGGLADTDALPEGVVNLYSPFQNGGPRVEDQYSIGLEHYKDIGIYKMPENLLVGFLNADGDFLGRNATFPGFVSTKVLTSPLAPEGLTIQLNGLSTGDIKFKGKNAAIVRKISYAGDITISDPDYGGGFVQKKYPGLVTLSGASTTLTLSIPTGSVIKAILMKVKTQITSPDGATMFTATFSGGATALVGNNIGFSKNTPIKKNGINIQTTAPTDIAFAPDIGTFSGGEVVAVVLTEELLDLTDFV